jgi:hypothetical protein
VFLTWKLCEGHSTATFHFRSHDDLPGVKGKMVYDVLDCLETRDREALDFMG